MKPVIAVALCLVAACAFAQPQQAGQFADLPANAQALAALRADPGVRAAMSGIGVEEAQARRLAAGSYEFTVRGDAARRRVTDPEPRDTYGEWALALERPLRLPGKRALDRQLGTQGVDVARLSAGDAMHEAGRSLLRLWFAWMKENAQLELWKQQAALAREQQSAVARRKRAGDAPRMELNLAEAATMQAEANWVQARSRETLARNALSRSFPGVAVPERALLLEPRPLEQGLEFWSEQVLAHNHQLAGARAEVVRRKLATQRALAERTPDPTVGVRFSNEFGGAEKVAGVYLSIPLPGAARRAAGEASAHQVGEAQAREAAALQRANIETAAAVESAAANFETWQRVKLAAEGMRKHAELAARAYQLGESGLADVLIARRMALEAQIASISAQLDAQEARYRLLLDAHRLWPLDPHEAEGHDGH